MYITTEIVESIEKLYGSPVEVVRSYEMAAREFDMVRRSQKHGRAHDVTMFIIRDNQVVVIRKPMYPPGAYRAPSGGISPGEPFEDGALREAYEETGLRIELARYLLRARVRFTCVAEAIDWTTHVFTALPTGGTLQPIDTHEIVEARFATVEELSGSIREALVGSGSTGLRYRAELGDLVVGMLLDDGALRR
ncbi:MAG TPA: NUDIX hydrolase [Blastocatellia bacterium]|jgi:8-oxo-dGTP pyrophosphatase MutT (NUDIX family)|nr:NUDIX hydrolase [Blastocatellia bacterium]